YRVSRLTGQSRLARDENDAAVLLRAKHRQEAAREGEDAKEICLHDAPNLRFGKILERADDSDADVGHYRIQPNAGLIQGRLDRGVDRRLVGKVELLEGDAVQENLIAQGTLEGVLLREIAHGRKDVPPAGRQKFRREVSEAGRCSGDQDSWHPVCL